MVWPVSGSPPGWLGECVGSGVWGGGGVGVGVGVDVGFSGVRRTSPLVEPGSSSPAAAPSQSTSVACQLPWAVAGGRNSSTV